jgi:hypothetical protein
MMKASEKLLQKIREREVTPTPKWRFTLRNSLLLAAFAAAVLLGALAFSVVLFAIQQTDFDILGHLTHSRLELFLGLLPFFWILVLVACLILAIYSVQYSPKGYKFTALRLAGYSAALSILLGALFFIAGGGRSLEKAFDTKVALYQSVQEKKARLWSMPEDGYLSGEIVEAGAGSLRLKDFKGEEWTVHFEGAFIPPAVLLERGETIKLIGEITEKEEFTASEIRPWGGYGFRGGRGR